MKKLLIASLMGLGALTAQAADIVDTAVSAGSFKTLVAAVQAAGLVDTQHGVGTFVLDMPAPEGFNVGPATIVLLSDVLDLLEFRRCHARASGSSGYRFCNWVTVSLPAGFSA